MILSILIIFAFLLVCSSYQIFPTKKFISITPAGIYGSYTLGIASYIQNNYNLNEYYSGVVKLYIPL